MASDISSLGCHFPDEGSDETGTFVLDISHSLEPFYTVIAHPSWPYTLGRPVPSIEYFLSWTQRERGTLKPMYRLSHGVICR